MQNLKYYPSSFEPLFIILCTENLDENNIELYIKRILLIFLKILEIIIEDHERVRKIYKFALLLYP